MDAFDDVAVDWDDLDEQTKKELLATGFARDESAVPAHQGGDPEPKCRWCGGTGKVALLTTKVDCDCARQG